MVARTIHGSRLVLLIISLEIKPSDLFHVQISPRYHILKVTCLAEFCLYTSDTKLCISSQLLQHLGTIQTGQNKGDIPAGWAAPFILQPYYSLILSGRKQPVKAPNPSVQEKLGPGAGLGAVLHPGLPNRKQGRGLTWRVPAPPKGKISSSVPAASPFYAGTKERGCSPLSFHVHAYS